MKISLYWIKVLKGKGKIKCKLKDTQGAYAAPAEKTRQLEYQTPKTSAAITHTAVPANETGVKQVDPASVISLDNDDFDRF